MWVCVGGVEAYVGWGGGGSYMDGWAERGYFQGKGERSLGNKLQAQCSINPNGWNLVGFNQRREWEREGDQITAQCRVRFSRHRK